MIVVSKHQAFVDYLLEIKMIEEGQYKLIPRVETYSEIQDEDVIGILPLHLAVLCNTVTEIPIIVPPEMRGQKLTLEQIRQYAKSPRRYFVERLEDGEQP